jgi:hypothetical protein
MENKNLVFVILVSVIIVVIASMAVPVFEKASQPVSGQAGGKVQPGQQLPPPGGREEVKQLKTAISFVNLALIIPLFVIYAGIYRKMKSTFTLGLMAVIFALLMYAVTSNPLVVGTLGGRIGDIGLFQIIPDLCTTAALLILVRISLE